MTDFKNMAYGAITSGGWSNHDRDCMNYPMNECEYCKAKPGMNCFKDCKDYGTQDVLPNCRCVKK